MLRAGYLRACLEEVDEDAIVLIDCGPMPVGPGRCEAIGPTWNANNPMVVLIIVDPG